MTTRTGTFLVLAVVLSGCTTGVVTGSAGVESGASATPTSSSAGVESGASATPTSSSAAEAAFPSGPAPEGCVRPPPDVTSVIEQTDPLACYGPADLVIDALVASPGTFSCPGELQPTWFDCFHLVALSPAPQTSARTPEFRLVARNTAEPSLFAVLHPDIEDLRLSAMDTVMHVTGHYDDPAAQDCVYVSYPDPGPPPADEVVNLCRTTFVISSMEPVEP